MGGRVMKRVGPDALSPGHRDCLPVWPATRRRLRSGAAPPPPPCGGGLVRTTLKEHSTAILTSLTTVPLISLFLSLSPSLSISCSSLFPRLLGVPGPRGLPVVSQCVRAAASLARPRVCGGVAGRLGAVAWRSDAARERKILKDMLHFISFFVMVIIIFYFLSFPEEL